MLPGLKAEACGLTEGHPAVDTKTIVAQSAVFGSPPMSNDDFSRLCNAQAKAIAEWIAHQSPRTSKAMNDANRALAEALQAEAAERIA